MCGFCIVAHGIDGGLSTLRLLAKASMEARSAKSHSMGVSLRVLRRVLALTASSLSLAMLSTN